jgi:hypothetical protein
MVDALASRAEEGRGKTAKSLGELSGKLSRGFPNGATRSGKTWVLPAEHIGWEEASRGSETSQYPEEKRLFPE